MSANFAGADLSGANLTSSDLTYGNFTGAKLDDKYDLSDLTARGAVLDDPEWTTNYLAKYCPKHHPSSDHRPVSRLCPNE